MAELNTVADIRGGATPRRDYPAYWNGDIPWATPTDLPALGEGISELDSTTEAISNEGLGSCSAQLLPPGTVLFSSRATIGKVGIAAVPLATNQGFANLIPKSGVESRYLAWSLYHNADRIAGLAGSTTFREVSKSAFGRFRIPIPPLSEQRGIVNILDQADRLRRLRAEADAKAARILPALFIKMFGDPATNPMGWPVAALRHFLSRVKRRDPKRSPETRFVYVDIASIDNQTGRIASTKKLFGHEAPGRARQIVWKNDVLVSTVRPYLRASAMVPNELDGQIGSTGFCVLRSATGCGYGYLYTLTRMPWFTEQLNARARGASYPAVTDQDIWNLRVPVPDDSSLLSSADSIVRETLAMQETQKRNSVKIQGIFDELLGRILEGEHAFSWCRRNYKQTREYMVLPSESP